MLLEWDFQAIFHAILLPVWCLLILKDHWAACLSESTCWVALKISYSTWCQGSQIPYLACRLLATVLCCACRDTTMQEVLARPYPSGH